MLDQLALSEQESYIRSECIPKVIFLKSFRIVLSVLLLVGAISEFAAQIDSSLIQQQFSSEDILNHPPEEEPKVYAAGRILEDPKELPQTIYIITKEEIINGGYFTLVDILKTLPGFRTSQPGSALLGETFLMRGLLGNNYTKILINGLPIKPYGVAGMPLGAQLPIRQAERIEVILGPSATLYGSDAVAGVINIVLPKVSRPVEAGADLTMGMNGTSQMDLSIAGKVGKGDHVIIYNLYGTQRTVADQNIDTDQFHADSVTQASPFYVGSIANSAIPEIRKLDHVSKLIGGRLIYNGLTISANSMFRKDHAALGADPGVIAYHNASSYMAEKIDFYTLQYNKSFSKKWTVMLNASLLNYEIDDNSSYMGIGHPLSNGNNFIYAKSLDWNVEPIVNFASGKFNVLLGGKYQHAAGKNYQGYLQKPDSDDAVFLDPVTGTQLVENSNDAYSSI
ncbi:MAG: TonB-dependent receptor plug domain-containing protein, partial [Flavobacteriales bacterium]|nr:TonB-dependent receptor plug domain-containing protein [Flavobacteriales bacterium]